VSKYQAIIHWSDEDKAFIAEVPKLAGCMADGASVEEAIANLKVVAQEWLETARELGRPIPEPENG
jgi:predicted RNase H-like HicB family nuclease